MKRIVFNIIVLSLLLAVGADAVYAAEPAIIIHKDQANEGLLKVTYRQHPVDAVHKLLVDKDGQRYTYDLLHGRELQNFPLQMGNGQYTIRVAELVEGTRFKEIMQETVTVVLVNNKAPYLHSVQEIAWHADNEAVKVAERLAKEMSGRYDKANVVYEIYSFIIYNIQYDYEKVNVVQAGYLPDIDQTLTDRKGICYDYASLFAAMLRSQGIPAKMVKGYAPNILTYHAWNEVYVETIDRWVTIDTVHDAIMLSNNIKTTIEKDKALFKIESEL